MDVETLATVMICGARVHSTLLRLGMDKPVKVVTALLSSLPQPGGQHGFAFPRVFIDMKRRECNAACETEDCDCGSIDGGKVFDIGSYLFNMFSRYLSTDGQNFTDMCFSG